MTLPFSGGRTQTPACSLCEQDLVSAPLMPQGQHTRFLSRNRHILRRCLASRKSPKRSAIAAWNLRKLGQGGLGQPLCFPCLFLLLLSRPLASCLYVGFVCVCVCLFFGARARAAMATLRPKLYVFLRRSLADSSPPPRARSFAPLWNLLPFPMADAAAPAVPRQQRRKEARAQTQDDSRRVRQRLEDLESRLETLEGRSRGHDLRLQYLEAPLKLVLKKFNGRLARIPVSRLQSLLFRQPFCRSCANLVGP